MRKGLINYWFEAIIAIPLLIIILIFSSCTTQKQVAAESITAQDLLFQDAFDRALLTFLASPLIPNPPFYTVPLELLDKGYTYGDLLTLSFLASSEQETYRKLFIQAAQKEISFVTPNTLDWQLIFTSSSSTFTVRQQTQSWVSSPLPISDKIYTHRSLLLPHPKNPLVVELHWWKVSLTAGAPLQ